MFFKDVRTSQKHIQKKKNLIENNKNFGFETYMW